MHTYIERGCQGASQTTIFMHMLNTIRWMRKR